MEKKLLKRGAEAELFETVFEGKKCLLKKRTRKSYRIEKLDFSIRKQRTKKEANLLSFAKSIGIETPRVYSVSEENFEISMEFIEGKRTKDAINSRNFRKICSGIGKNAAKLHNCGIIHGDLTTSNIMLRGKELVFIDFGLGFHSKKTEDKAVDLLNLKKTFQATHCSFFEQGWNAILKAYCKETGERTVAVHIAEIEKRGRYF